MKIGLLISLLLIVPGSTFANFGFHTGAHLGYGKLGTENESVSSRSVSTLDLQFMPGYRMGIFMPGLLLDYRFIGQLGSDREYGGTDYGGRSFMLGLGATADIDNVKALFSYDIRARHSSAIPENTYKGSGFHLMVGYLLMPKLSIDFAFTQANYNAVENSNGVETEIADNKFKHWNIGLGISYSY